jgi:DNA-binding beta-propeller fold protein YncE
VRTPILSVVMLVLSVAWAAGETPPPSFTRKPTVARDAGSLRIDFAVDRETDVAVYVEDAKGQVVRHLVAGVLGPNPPTPLKPNSLAQSVVWDGKDDDGTSVRGSGVRVQDSQTPFRVRVALGLAARYAGTAFAEQDGPNHLSSVLGLAAGPDGRVYVMDDRSGWLYWPAKAVHVFRRDGAYEKTIKPFPAHLPAERVKAASAFVNDRGHLNPLIHRALGMTFYPFEDEPAALMAVAGDRLILAVVPSQSPPTSNPMYRGIAAHLAAIDLDGGIPTEGYAGPALGKALVYQGERAEGGLRIAASSDGRWVYLVNLGHRYYENGYKLKKHPVVYRAPLPAMGPAEVFFGDVETIGADDKHLNQPMGVATDGQGRLFVADFGNNRVAVLNEADRAFVGAFPVEAPAWVGVHPKTGAIYVYAKDRLVKFSGWQNPKEVAALGLGRAWVGLADWRKDAQRLTFALDAAADPPVIWMGQTMGSLPLQRAEDRGTTFSDFAPAGCYQSPKHWRPAADPLRRLVLCRVSGTDGDRLLLLDEATGQMKSLRIPSGRGSNQGTQTRLDRDGNLYSSSAEGGIWKSDQAGKMLPFPATADDPKLKGHIPGGSSGTTAWERDFTVDRRGDIYAKVRGTAYHGLMHVDVFGPDGAMKRTVLWGVTDGAYGPRVDPAGNLYLMECLKPVGQPFPDEFKTHVTDRVVKHWYDWMYGSIVKFAPTGGNLYLNVRDAKADRPRAEPVALPQSIRREQVASSLRGDANEVQGALWIRPGVSHVGDMGISGGGEHCHCTGCDFDVDDFGRAFAPDNGRQRVTVLDTNGNVILHFGGYGNQDSCGPEIGINFLIGLAVTERQAYLADCGNRRVLRVRLDYAGQETVDLP